MNRISIPGGVIPLGRRVAMATGIQGDVAMLALDKSGLICNCDACAEDLFKYRRGELDGHHVSLLLPELADLDLTLNDESSRRLRYFCHIGRRFQAVSREGERFASELVLNVLDTRGYGRLSLLVRPLEAAGRHHFLPAGRA